MLKKLKTNSHFLNGRNDLWEKYGHLYHRIAVAAKTILLKEGEISKKAYLIEKGCIRIWINHEGKDITFQFFFENEAVSSMESFRKNQPSLFNVETIEPCVLHWIAKKDFDKILKDSAVKELVFEAVLDRVANYTRHFISSIKDSPQRRYAALLKEKPHILQRVPLQCIASYLGITPVSLSRIRNRI